MQFSSKLCVLLTKVYQWLQRSHQNVSLVVSNIFFRSTYSCSLHRTVFLYLALLPFQLVDRFEWYTILGVSIASFIYLGFVAAGEELEQPFGMKASVFQVCIY